MTNIQTETSVTSGVVSVACAGSHKTFAGPAEWFTGTVNVEMLFTAPDPASVSGGLVTFLPGARTAWHTHPLGQTLVVASGFGRVQHWDGRVRFKLMWQVDPAGFLKFAANSCPTVGLRD